MDMKKMLGTGLALAAVAGLALPAASQAAVVSDEIILGPYSAASSPALPPLNVATGDSLQLTVLNPSPEPVTFAVPRVGVTYVIPANSERIVFVDAATIAAANLAPGERISYDILDASGNRLASGSVVNDTTLASIIERNEVVAVTETTTTTTTTAVEPMREESRATVRGFW